jgi:hypothetical protein
MTASTPFPRSLALYLAAVQCVATASWIAYVVYLPRLATSAGVPASAVGWILIADQVLFALADLALGQAADRALRVMRTLGPWLVAITVVSGAAFVAVPLFSGTVAPPLFLALIFFWAAASSVLRAPALALVAKRTPTPALPWLGSKVRRRGGRQRGADHDQRLSLAADGVLDRRRAPALACWHRGARRLMPGNKAAAYNPVTCGSNPGHA